MRQAANQGCSVCRVQRAKNRPERVDDQRIGQSLDRERPAFDHPESAVGRGEQGLAGEPGLSNARLTGDEKRRSVPCQDTIKRAGDPLKLGTAADQHSAIAFLAGDRASHTGQCLRISGRRISRRRPRNREDAHRFGDPFEYDLASIDERKR